MRAVHVTTDDIAQAAGPVDDGYRVTPQGLVEAPSTIGDVPMSVVCWAVYLGGYQGDPATWSTLPWVWVEGETSVRRAADRLVAEWRMAGCPWVEMSG